MFTIRLRLIAGWIFYCFASYAQHTCVFVGSYNWDKTTEGIYVFELDTIDGTLQKICSLKGIRNPSYLTISPNGRFVYACTETKTPNAGSVSSFEFNYECKTFIFLNDQLSGGENPVYLNVHKSGAFLINANYTESSVSVYPLSEDGKIDPMIQLIHYSEGSVNKVRQERSHLHAAVFSPNFEYIFLPDLGADKIRYYQFDTTQQEPLKSVLPSPFINVTPGSGPRHFTFHPFGNFAYCIDELSGTISTYKYEKERLTPFQRVPAHSSKYKEGFESSDVHVSPDGKFLYATNRGKENNIAIFSIEKDGILKIKSYQPVYGSHPRVFAIDHSGKFLIVGNVSTNNVIVFKRNVKTGLLKKMGEVSVTHPSSIQIKEYY